MTISLEDRKGCRGVRVLRVFDARAGDLGEAS
jgi:hypothetical protein